ncbi:MAG: AMP-binding protein, partial [Roseococcus sp.]
MSAISNLGELLQRGSAAQPALRAPGRPALTHQALRELAVSTVATLNAKGIGRGDRVAIVLPNGPEMAAAFLCVAAGASTAPLNPSYKGDEFTFYLDDLKPKAIIVQQGDAT